MSTFEEAVRSVRFLAVDAVEQAGNGHPGTPMALAGIGVELFANILRYDPKQPDWPNRDRFVLSAGHASMLLYALLHLAGYDLSIDDLRNFRQLDSKTPGHPEYGHTPGVETTTGPLGQGVGNAVGLALAGKLLAARMNQPDSTLIDYRVFTLASDGDMMEGVASEAASLAGHLRLDNLIVVYDDNRITIDGGTGLTFSEDVGKRFEAYGWFVQRVDGHAQAEVRAALDRAIAEGSRPSLIVARTTIGFGAPNKQGTSAAHGAALGTAEAEATKRAAGWPLEPKFRVPPGVRELFAEHVGKNRREIEAWHARLEALDEPRRQSWERHFTRVMPEDILAELLAVAESKSDATRSLASKIEQRAAALVPALIGGSADLAESLKTTIKDGGDVAPGRYEGRNLHFGVREHGMGAILNGLALSGGFIPFGSTFMIFSDYMRPPMRLAALMRLQVIYVFSHDSVFLGEDGPTHQPVEQLATLRLVPNLLVVRPADSFECAAAWALALERRSGPTAIILTRQKIPALERPAPPDPEDLRRGAYVLADAPNAELVLIATGSEVPLAAEVAKLLGARGRPARVVSAPCWELFAEQPAAVQARVLGSGRRIAIEAGRSVPWQGVVGPTGIAIGIDRFGMSAPWERIASAVGLTAEQVLATILSRIE